MKTSQPKTQYWLLKSEGTCYSINDLKKDGVTAWEGVRNFQARNFMTQGMKVGDGILFYHSSSKPTGVFGLAQVASMAHPDVSAQNKKDEHYDPRATTANPVWMCVDVKYVETFKNPVTLDQIKFQPKLVGMTILKQGNRLSITPVSETEYNEIVRLGR
jgi:predicted RNA-binding protein with PUA-like domain